MYIMNILDFFIISAVFVIMSYVKDSNVCVLLLKPLIVVSFIIFYFNGNHIKSYTFQLYGTDYNASVYSGNI